MTVISKPEEHKPPCERASKDGCTCSCRGMMHQNNILIAAMESAGTASSFRSELDELFGSAFTNVTSAPSAGQRVRRGTWDAHARPSSARESSQVEKRVVDVTLGDVLANVHGLNIPSTTRQKWSTLVDLLTGSSSHWETMSAQVQAVCGKPNSRSGYFWASMLAAASDAIATQSGSLTATQIGAAVSPTFRNVRHPRARSGRVVQPIDELGSPAIIQAAGRCIASALAAVPMTATEARLVVSVTGAAVSADLWRHPVAVKHLLLPAVSSLRTTYNQQFSLDGPGLTAENVIAQELGNKWSTRNAW